MPGGVKMVFTGESGDLAKELARMQGEMGKLRGQLARVRAEARGARQAKSQAFGTQAVGELKAYVTGLVGVGTAIAGVTTAFQAMRQAREEWVAGLREQEGGLKRLAQVAKTPTEFEYYRGLAQQYAVAEGMELPRAYEFIFQAVSQGLMAQTDFLATTERFADAVEMMTTVGKMTSAFGPAETGTAEQIVSKVTEAARTSDISIEDMARAAVIAAQPAGAVRTTDEELLALLSILSPGAKSKETAAKQIAQLAVTLRKGVEVPTGRRVRDVTTGQVVPERVRVQYDQEGILRGMQRYMAEHPKEWEEALISERNAASAARSIMLNLPAIEAAQRNIARAGETLGALRAAQAVAEAEALRRTRAERSQKIAIEVANEGAATATMDLAQAEREYVQLYRERGRGWETLAELSVWLSGIIDKPFVSREAMVAGYREHIARERESPPPWAPADAGGGSVTDRTLTVLTDLANSLRRLVEQGEAQATPRPAGLRPVAADDGEYAE